MDAFVRAMTVLCPGINWSNDNNTYEGIRWPEGFTPPSKEAFEAELAKQSNPVPQEVWAGAMMRALNATDMLEKVDQIVAASDDWLLKKLWARAAAFRRDDPMIVAVGQATGWSEKDLDDLFRLAGSFDK